MNSDVISFHNYSARLYLMTLFWQTEKFVLVFCSSQDKTGNIFMRLQDQAFVFVLSCACTYKNHMQFLPHQFYMFSLSLKSVPIVYSSQGEPEYIFFKLENYF